MQHCRPLEPFHNRFDSLQKETNMSQSVFYLTSKSCNLYLHIATVLHHSGGPGTNNHWKRNKSEKNRGEEVKETSRNDELFFQF